MSQSLDHFVRDIMREHAGLGAEDQSTAILQADAPRSAAGMGALPGHEVEGLIARGGMGAVYKARQKALEREVAVKVMTARAESPEMAERFRREALVLGRLAHPNIVPVHDIGTDDEGQLFYTMKLVKGRTLQHMLHGLRQGDADMLRQHSLASLLTIFRKVCDAMAFAHSQGVLHRDLKPENVMVGEFGEVLVMDWGLAKMLKLEGEEPKAAPSDAQPASDTASGPSLASFQSTLDGAVMGTPQYMSPEQALGHIDELDERSDIFSLGGILYAILTLRPPVEGQTLEEVLRKVTAAEITSPSELTTSGHGKSAKKGDVLDAKLIKPLPHTPNGRVPQALSSVAMKALRLEKARRYQGVAELSADIEAYQGGFATSAEQAGALRQLMLLMQRHKGAAASFAAMVVLSIGFVLKVMASERKATQNAEIATANEKRASENAEQTRRALGTSQIAVAEAAYRTADLQGMILALDSVPLDLRDQRWDYLSQKRDGSLGGFRLDGIDELTDVKAVPGQMGQFAVADKTGVVAIVDVRSATVLWRIKTGLRGKMVLAVSEDGSRLAITAKNATEIRLHRCSDGVAEKSISSPSSNIRGLAFSPDGQQIVVLDLVEKNSNASKVRLLDLRDGAVRWEHSGLYNNAFFSPDGRRLFIASSTRRAFTVLGVEKGELISEKNEYVICMAMSRDRGRIALGLYSGEVVIYNVATGAEMRRARLHVGTISHITWTAGDHLLTIGNEAGFDKGRPVMRLWETSGFSARAVFFGIPYSGPRLHEYDFEPLSGHLLLLTNSQQLWRIPADVEAARLRSDRAEQGWSTCFLSDKILLGRADYALQCYNVADPLRPVAVQPPYPQGYVMSAVNWPGGVFAIARRIAGPLNSLKLFRYNESRIKEEWEIPMPTYTMRMDFDPAGKKLLAVAENRGALILDVNSGKTLRHLPPPIDKAVFTANGDRIVAVMPMRRMEDDVEDKLMVIDAATGNVLKVRVYRVRLDELAVSPNRKLIAIGTSEQVVRVLDAETLEERIRFRAHDAGISALAFHPKLPVLASASLDGSVKLWDCQDAKLQNVFLGFDGTPVMLAFSPNGRLLSVEAQEHTARLFDLSGESAPAVVKSALRVSFPMVGDDWLGLINSLSDEDIRREGNGWRRAGGVLSSPERGPALLPLPVILAGTSYQLRVKFRQVVNREVLHFLLPVADRMVGFDLDGAPLRGCHTGLVQVNGKYGKILPGTLTGKQINDYLLHELEFNVRLHETNATITTLLDGRPFHEWSGPVASLEQLRLWSGPRGRPALGTMSADWKVEEMKVRRL